MAKVKSDTLHVQGINVGIYTEDYRNEYISLTDIARYRNSDDPRFAIQNWMRNRNTIEFLGLWETLHNPNFNRVQFDTFRSEAGSASYFSPQIFRACIPLVRVPKLRFSSKYSGLLRFPQGLEILGDPVVNHCVQSRTSDHRLTTSKPSWFSCHRLDPSETRS